MRTYWTAHALAARGHDVHVVTNAKEVLPPFRMLMRPEDWERCEARYGAGSVTVHWTDPLDPSQAFIPMANPFVSKLAGIVLRLHDDLRFDVIYSHYLEPYGVAASLAAQFTGVPHVARMAGSDAGRLWHHPQLQALYDHVLCAASLVIATGEVAERVVARGIPAERIVFAGGFTVPDYVFTSDGPSLDLAALRADFDQDPEVGDVMWGEFAGERPYFGIYGKLGTSKGSFALLEAMHQLKQSGLKIALVALAHGQPNDEQRFRARARELGLADCILQIPFLPHWRVPEFLRSCLAVCCLEQDFTISFHSPIIPLEVLLCGACLVGTTEVIRKFPHHPQLVHRYDCVAIKDVNDIEALAFQLAAIARDPKPARAVGRRGRGFARKLQQEMNFPEALEAILRAAAARRGHRTTASCRLAVDVVASDMSLTTMAEAALGKAGYRDINLTTAQLGSSKNDTRARAVLAALDHALRSGCKHLVPLAAGVRIEIAIAQAERDIDNSAAAGVCDPIFRLSLRRWAADDGDLLKLVPVRDSRLRVLEFDFDVADFMDVRTEAEIPITLTARPSYLVVFGPDSQRSPLVIDEISAVVLKFSDGTRTAAEIARELESENVDALQWIEDLFVHSLLSLTDRP
jgi:glycosyltransferase involved in cell wall biosynthesis